MRYEVSVGAAASRRLAKLPVAVRESVYSLLEQLEFNPRPPGSLKLTSSKLVGWRVRIGKYRLLYQIDDTARRVQIYDIELRDKAYKTRK